MRHRVIYLSDPVNDVTPYERLYIERELGPGWTDDLDFAVIVANGWTSAPSDLLGDRAVGHAYDVELGDGRHMWLKYHA